MEKKRNEGRKVRIKEYGAFPQYEGKIGTIVIDHPIDEYYHVKMDGTNSTLMPYREYHEDAQCELLPEENEYHIDKLRDQKFWVATPTQELWNKVCEVFQRAGIRWCSNIEATGNEDCWGSYKASNGIGYNYNGDGMLGYSPKSTYEHSIKIFITAESFIQSNQPTMNKNTQALEQIELLKQQILKIEESLKEPEYKVGDVVYIISGGSGAYGVNGKIGTITNERCTDGHTSSSIRVKVKDSVWGLTTDGIPYNLRKATPEEIAANQQITVTIGTEGKVVTISKGKIVAPDGKVVTIEDINMVCGIMMGTRGFNSWTVTFPEVKIGCIESISYDQLKAVQDAYHKING